MTNHPRRKRGLLTGLVAVATALTLAFSAAPAQADGPTIDPAATGTLHIHKYEQPAPVGAESTGLPQDTTGLTPMAGIVFTAQLVDGVDLTTNAGWEYAATLSVSDAAAAVTGPLLASGPTSADGLATIADLPVGLYYVTETTHPNNVTPVVPFVVAMPMTHPTERDQWLYDVHVYPKNATTNAEKTVVDEGSFKLGDNVEWMILADIPKAEVIDKYTIVDELDSRLDYVSTVVSLTGTPGVTLDLEVDYTIVNAPENTITVMFTAAGRAKLASAWQEDPNSQVQVDITTTANAVGEIENMATVFPNSTSTGVETNAVVTKWGTLVLKKIDSRTETKNLPNAEFQVFRSLTDAQNKTNPIVINEGTPQAKSTFTSNAQGIVLIEGLRYSNWENGEEVLVGDANYQWYWIAETKAPAGYEMLAEPIKVDVTGESTTVVTDVVKNVLKNAGFALPLTGASGATTIFMVAGLLMLVVGTAAVVVSRRKKGQAQA